MELKLVSKPLPLIPDEGGAVRVRGTRIPMETIISEYLRGQSAEGIVEAFPTLRLGDVYAVLAFYLDHRDEVDAYLRERSQIGEQTLRMIKANSEQQGFKDRLLVRRRQLELERKKSDGSLGEPPAERAAS